MEAVIPVTVHQSPYVPAASRPDACPDIVHGYEDRHAGVMRITRSYQVVHETA